jgi:hypothetical protein
MQTKSKALNTLHWGKKRAEDYYNQAPKDFDYGPMDKIGLFKGTHPEIMREMISKHNWKDKLQKTGRRDPHRKPHKHEELKCIILTWIEKYLNCGRQIGAFKNYILIKEKRKK